MDARDRFEFRALFDEAFDLRDTPYLRDACEHLIEWRAKTNLRQFAREQQRDAVISLLRESSHLLRDKRDKREKDAV